MEKIVEQLIELVKEDSKQALGCTEPVAVAYCANVASKYINNPIDKIICRTSKNIFKNGKSVKIPNTGSFGLDLAVALGALVEETAEGFLVFNKVNDVILNKAKELLIDGKVKVTYLDESPDVYVSVLVFSGNDVSEATLSGSHTHIQRITVNNEIIYEDKKESNLDSKTFHISELSFSKIRNLIEDIDVEDILFVLEGIDVNKYAAYEGLKGYGSKLGQTLNDLKQKGVLSDDLVTNVRIMTAAAADMRMGGGSCPIVTSGGSGNQGIGVLLPIALVAEQENINDENLAKAIFFAHVINRYVKEYSGKLSGICGCAIGAAIGATAGITWLLGGTDEQIAGACTNIYANITGVVCDGAKESCSMKLSTSAVESVIAAYLAVSGIISESNVGVIGSSIEKTISNIGRLSKDAFVNVDEVMLEIINH